MKAQAIHAAPDHHVAMKQRNFLGLVAALMAAEQKNCRQAQGHRHHGRIVTALILILVQRHLCARYVTVDQAGVGRKVDEACVCGCLDGQLAQRVGHVWPGLLAARIQGAVAIAAGIGGPAQIAATAQCGRHGKAAGSDHLSKRRLRQHLPEFWKKAINPGQGVAPQYVRLFANLFTPCGLLQGVIGEQVGSGAVHGLTVPCSR